MKKTATKAGSKGRQEANLRAEISTGYPSGRRQSMLSTTTAVLTRHSRVNHTNKRTRT